MSKLPVAEIESEVAKSIAEFKKQGGARWRVDIAKRAKEVLARFKTDTENGLAIYGKDGPHLETAEEVMSWVLAGHEIESRPLPKEP